MMQFQTKTIFFDRSYGKAEDVVDAINQGEMCGERLLSMRPIADGWVVVMGVPDNQLCLLGDEENIKIGGSC